MDAIKEALDSVNDRLTKIDKKLCDVQDWSLRFTALENRISSLETTADVIDEIKTRITKIEAVLEVKFKELAV